MSEKLPNMLETTIQKIREMVDVNSVIGQPINTPDGVTIIPGFFARKHFVNTSLSPGQTH